MSRSRRRLVGGWALVLAVTAAALVLPLVPSTAEGLRVSVCRKTGGSCGYVPARIRCDVLARDTGVASGVTAIRAVSDPADRTTTTKMLDGVAVVEVRPADGRRLDQLAAARLAVVVADRPLSAADRLTASYRFARHDDADAWLDGYHRAGAPVVAASAGWHGDGLAEGVRRVVLALGFDDPQALSDPQGVQLDVPRQAAGPAGYWRAQAAADPLLADPLLAGAPARLELDAGGGSTTTGRLALADDGDDAAGSLAGRLGLAGEPTYSVTTDPGGTPVSLTITGEAALDGEGEYASSAELSQVRERGQSESPGARAVEADRAQGIRTMQTVVLDLRSATNRAAFAEVFSLAGPVATLRGEGAHSRCRRGYGRRRCARTRARGARPGGQDRPGRGVRAQPLADDFAGRVRAGRDRQPRCQNGRRRRCSTPSARTSRCPAAA